MSRFRGSPSRSPFRSPPRLYETQRDAIIEDQIRIKSAIKAQSDYRRINDELALLQIKVRHTNELEDKVESLMRQNNQLARDNDDLARELSERRYELQRLRITASEHHERQSIRNAQILQANRALELQIQLVKKERLEATRLFESHIDKLERTLDAKIMELDAANFRCSELNKELEVTTIRFEEEKNRLKNLMTRTQHQLERQLEYTKQKQTSEKFSEIDILKRNHGAQLALLEDEISKLKLLNQVKTEEFESQLAENKNLRKRHDEQVRLLGAENDDIRARMLKLQQINRSEVQTIQVKYSDIHTQGTTNLKEQYGRQIKLLLDQIDKLKWLVSQKNAEIQNLVQDKRQLRRALDETQLQLGSEIQSLKNQKYVQQAKHTEQSHAQMAKINQLIDSAFRDSESYHERAKQFRNKIANLESEINDKQNSLDNYKKSYESKIKQLNRYITELNYNYEKVKGQLAGSQDQRAKAQARFQQYQTKAQSIIRDVSKKLSDTQVKLEQKTEKLARQNQDHKGNEATLLIQNETQAKTIRLLQSQLSQEQKRHSDEMNDFSSNWTSKVSNLQAAQKKTIENLEKGFTEQLKALQLRIEKLLREKQDANNDLRKYIQMYKSLEKYFKSPHDGALFEEKSENEIYKVLQKVSQSTIHIF